MKIVTIGRDPGNDVVINDSVVSRWHCEIIQDDSGNFLLKDIQSTNGTYVNGVRRSGTTRLNKSDIIRIGNTTLPWQTYIYSDNSRNSGFTSTGIGYGGNTYSQNIIKIGRGVDNDINVADSFVSGKHCQIIIEDDGEVTLVDVGSKNGTYVNGNKIHGATKLSRTDVVRIGNTTIPWTTYINRPLHEPIRNPIVDPTPVYPVYPPNPKSGLGTIALILSIAGTILMIYVAIRLSKWGFFAWFGKGSTLAFVALGMHLVAYVIASIADAKEYKDSDSASIAEWLSGFCIGIIIVFFIYLKINPDILNPFKNIL